MFGRYTQPVPRGFLEWLTRILSEDEREVEERAREWGEGGGGGVESESEEE